MILERVAETYKEYLFYLLYIISSFFKSKKILLKEMVYEKSILLAVFFFPLDNKALRT